MPFKCTFSFTFFLLLCQCQYQRIREPEDAERFVWKVGEVQHNTNNHVVIHEHITPIRISSFRPECTADKALTDLGKVQIWVHDENEKKLVEFDFSETSGIGLKNRYSLGVIKNFHLKQEYHHCQNPDPTQKSRFQCPLEDITLMDAGDPILFCDKGPFPMDSLENAALSAMASILKSSRFYEPIQGVVWSTRMYVLLFPKYEKVVHIDGQKSLYVEDTDNARWSIFSHTKESQFIIEVLPHSEQRKSTFGKEIWSQLALISHEFGHHLFYHQSSAYLAEKGKVQDSSIYSIFLDGENAPPNRSVHIQTVIDAINEGYADLISFYSFNSGVNTFGKFVLGKFKTSRFIGDSHNDDKKEKILSASVLKHFFNIYKTRPKNYLTPDHQDIHTIGAIVGHIIDKLFEEKVGGSALQPKSLEKATLLDRWVKSIDLKYYEQQNKNPQQFLQDIMLEAVKLAFLNPDQKTLNKNQCDTIASKMPVYQSAWQQEGQYQCYKL